MNNDNDQLSEFKDNYSMSILLFYFDFLPFSYLFDLKRTNCYLMLNASHVNPRSILLPWFGQSEVNDIAGEYNISDTFNKSSIVQMMWTSF